MKLFPKDKTVGIFRGFSEGGLEFHADLVLPYKNEFQSTPMHGHFLLVQLEHEEEAVLGRITSMSSSGRLASGQGEDYGLRAVSDDRIIPEDLREQYLKYKVNIRVLGVVRMVNGSLQFAASHRRLPHVGSKVAFLSDDVLREVAAHNVNGAEVGYFTLGEFIYSGTDQRLKKEDWMQVKSPAVIAKFDVKHLVARRSFVFARAGFGKSNLVKLLFSNLYKTTPTVEKRGGRQVPVGTLIFDPDGEYFWPDDKNRPGLCDVPDLEDKVVVFTKKKGPSPFYDSFVAGDIKLDIRRLRPADVIGIGLPVEKQDHQNVAKLKGMNSGDWALLVNEIYANGNAANEATIGALLRLRMPDQQAEAIAARSNMTRIVSMLHDPSSQLMDMLIASLKAGKICVVDISQMRGNPALILSGLLLQRVFDHNQDEFTKAVPETIPTLAIVEEAQSVLGSSGGGGEGPYIAWVKEGRKYDLGAVLITQQPGSISNEILSQGDNWFIFHLLSAGDLRSVKNVNAHFSDDILSTLLNEPIPGHGVFWSSAGGKSYPIPLRVLSFEQSYKARDPSYNQPRAKTFAEELKGKFHAAVTASQAAVPASKPIAASPSNPQASFDLFDDDGSGESSEESGEEAVNAPVDVMGAYADAAIAKVASDTALLNRIKTSGIAWFGIVKALEDALPEILDNRNNEAFKLVPRFLTETFGERDEHWETKTKPKKDGQGTTLWLYAK
jgi:DNA helicase HerA-like ATPase